MSYLVKSAGRDLGQKSLGCIGFSFFVHIVLLFALIVSAKTGKDLLAPRERASSRETVVMELGETNPAAAQAPTVNRDVILADTSDLEAVALPPTKAVAKSRAPAAKPRIAKAPARPALVTTADGDVTVREALKAARETAPVEEAQTPETSEVTKSEEPESLSPEIAPEEMAAAPVAAVVPEKIETPAPVTTEEPTTPASAAISTAKSASPAQQVVPQGAAPVSQAPQRAPMAVPGNGGSTSASTGVAAAGQAGTGAMVIIDASLRRPLAGNPLPAYPQRDRYLRRQGTTVMVGRVGTDGRVNAVQIERRSGSDTIDQASVDAFRKWRFAPGSEALVRKSFVFNLTGDEKVVPARLGRR